MTSRFDARLAGKGLLNTVPEIRVLDISYSPATISDDTFEPAYGNGTILTRRRYGGASVTITVEAHEYDPAERNRICQKLVAWASSGGNLTTSDREGQRLAVRCTNIPTIASALRWTDQISMEFTATVNPFWEAVEEQTVQITEQGDASVTMLGNVESARVSATIKSGNRLIAGGAMKNLTIKTGSTQMKLENMNVSKVQQVLIAYDKNGFLTIKTSAGDDLMKYRTGADELLLTCGKTSKVSITANTAVTCTLSARGLYL